jgi:hypothetical protein
MNAKPWDILNPNIEHVPEEIYNNRMDICNKCEHLIELTKTCKKCGCFMSIKNMLPHAYCPINKFQEYSSTPENY